MLEFGYVALTLLMAVIILFGYNYALVRIGIEPALRKKRVAFVAIGLLAWFVYTYLIGQSGILENLEMPPRFPLLLVAPAFIFTAVLLYRNRNSRVISAIPKSWTIYYQTFRILVESLFLASVSVGLLHPEATLEGYNYDMLMGISAPIIAYLVFKAGVLPEKIAVTWNYIGLVVLASVIFVFVTTTYFPSIWGSAESLAPKELTTFPFVLVPSFLMPSAVFMHILSIMRLRRSNS